MKARFKVLGSVAALGLFAAAAAVAGGRFGGEPQFGGPSYCFSQANGSCVQYAPAGPAALTGSEVVPVDSARGDATMGGTITTGIVALPQLGQGAAQDVTTVGTTQTVPASTPFYFLDGAQGSALTVTMPALPLPDGYIQHVVCEAATVGTLTVAANTGQTLKGNPNTACVAGVGYHWRYSAANATWYRF